MQNLSELLDVGCMQLEMKARQKFEAIEELVQLLLDCGKISDKERFIKELLERENLSSTGIGQGIAIPHRLTAGVDKTHIAFGRKVKGVPFESVDQKPAHIIFLILGPQGQHSEHLRILSSLSRYLHDRAFFEALMRAQSPLEIVQLIKSKEESTHFPA